MWPMLSFLFFIFIIFPSKCNPFTAALLLLLWALAKLAQSYERVQYLVQFIPINPFRTAVPVWGQTT